MNVGVLYSRVRADEKRLLTELRERDHAVRKLDVRELSFPVGGPPEALRELDLVVDRCLATSRSLYVTRFLESYGVPVVNGAETAAVCADKVRTSLALAAADVPTPATEVAFTPEAALETIERFGYPCVLKPVVGSWGRLMAKLEGRAAAEAVLEHKETLGHYEHGVFYVQEYVDKPGRDLRVVTADGEPVAAMSRAADDWRTNAGRGAETSPYDPAPELRELAARASAAVGGGLLGVDAMETGDPDRPYVVHEVNHTVEFRALDDAVSTDVPAAVVDWLETVAARHDGTGDGEEVTAT